MGVSEVQAACLVLDDKQQQEADEKSDRPRSMEEIVIDGFLVVIAGMCSQTLGLRI